MNALCSERRDISLYMISRHVITLKVLEHSKNIGNWRDMNTIENVWNIMKKEIGNHMSCKKEEMWKPVCKPWYSVAPNVL